MSQGDPGGVGVTEPSQVLVAVENVAVPVGAASPSDVVEQSQHVSAFGVERQMLLGDQFGGAGYAHRMRHPGARIDGFSFGQKDLGGSAVRQHGWSVVKAAAGLVR